MNLSLLPDKTLAATPRGGVHCQPRKATSTLQSVRNGMSHSKEVAQRPLKVHGQATYLDHLSWQDTLVRRTAACVSRVSEGTCWRKKVKECRPVHATDPVRVDSLGG